MVNWFGPAPWNGLICTDAPRCEAPVGTACLRCGVAIHAFDEGVTMPGSDGPVTFHLRCHLKSVVPHHAWPSHGLVPEACDGLRDGRFECPTCGVSWSAEAGWHRP